MNQSKRQSAQGESEPRINEAGTVCEGVGGSDQGPVRRLWADGLQMENMALKLEIAAVKSKLAEEWCARDMVELQRVECLKTCSILKHNDQDHA